MSLNREQVQSRPIIQMGLDQVIVRSASVRVMDEYQVQEQPRILHSSLGN